MYSDLLVMYSGLYSGNIELYSQKTVAFQTAPMELVVPVEWRRRFVARVVVRERRLARGRA